MNGEKAENIVVAATIASSDANGAHSKDLFHNKP